MKPKDLPDPSYLHECFEYNPRTGCLKWRKRRPLAHFKSQHGSDTWHGRYPGAIAGTANHPDGYVRVRLGSRKALAHRIIWVLMTGEEAPEIDHRNGIRNDNRWRNLRAATSQQNTWNRHKRRSAALPKGVMQRSSGRFGAYHRNKLTGVDQCLGTFDTPKEAHAAWCEAVRRERGEYFRAR